MAETAKEIKKSLDFDELLNLAKMQFSQKDYAAAVITLNVLTSEKNWQLPEPLKITLFSDLGYALFVIAQEQYEKNPSNYIVARENFDSALVYLEMATVRAGILNQFHVRRLYNCRWYYHDMLRDHGVQAELPSITGRSVNEIQCSDVVLVFQQAKDEHKQQQYLRAIKKYEDVLALNPTAAMRLACFNNLAESWMDLTKQKFVENTADFSNIKRGFLQASRYFNLASMEQPGKIVYRLKKMNCLTAYAETMIDFAQQNFANHRLNLENTLDFFQRATQLIKKVVEQLPEKILYRTKLAFAYYQRECIINPVATEVAFKDFLNIFIREDAGFKLTDLAHMEQSLSDPKFWSRHISFIQQQEKIIAELTDLNQKFPVQHKTTSLLLSRCKQVKSADSFIQLVDYYLVKYQETDNPQDKELYRLVLDVHSNCSWYFSSDSPVKREEKGLAEGLKRWSLFSGADLPSPSSINKEEPGSEMGKIKIHYIEI